MVKYLKWCIFQRLIDVFNKFNESLFLIALASDLEYFHLSNNNVDDDFTHWLSIVQGNLDKHAPIKTRRVKSKRLPDWFTPAILSARKMRDTFKRAKNWSKYKLYRNKTRDLIWKAKKKHFSESIASQKDTRTLWKHFRSVTNKDNASLNTLPEELNIDNEIYTDSEKIAVKLNEYFASVSDQYKTDCDSLYPPNFSKLEDYVQSKIPPHVYFTVPYITLQQVSKFINTLDPAKATGLYGLGPRILKMAASILAPSITSLINKSIETSTFPSNLKVAKLHPIHKNGNKSDPSNYRPISILPTISKFFEKHINKHLMGFLNKYTLLHENQSGFRPKPGCQTALIKLVDKWMACIDKGDIVGALFWTSAKLLIW